jgi:hypothetical protein
VVKYTVDEVKLAWTDMGNKMFGVHLTREDGTKWYLRIRAKDEIEAYTLGLKQVAKKEQKDGLSE